MQFFERSECQGFLCSWSLLLLCSGFSVSSYAAEKNVKSFIDAEGFCGSAQVTNELFFLKSTFDAAGEFACKQDVTKSGVTLAAAQVDSATTAHYPTATLSSQIGLQETRAYDHSTRTNPDDKATKNAGLTLSLSEKAWAGGVDQKNVELSKKRHAVAKLDSLMSSLVLQSNILKDVVKLVGEIRIDEQRKQELQQWKILNEYTHKKAKSGNLNVRDTLQSDKETDNAAADVANNEQALVADLALFMKRYGLEQQNMQKADLAAFMNPLEELASKASHLFSTESCEKNVFEASADAHKTELQRQISQEQISVKRVEAWSPEFRLGADVGLSYIDNVNNSGAVSAASAASRVSAGRSTDLPNWSLTPSVSARFSMSLWNPLGLSQITEAQESLKQTVAADQKLQNSVRYACATQKSQIEALELKLKNAQQILATTQKLTLVNQRLFDAGFIDTFELIRGLQDRYSQERSIVDLQNQLQSAYVSSYIAHTWGVLGSES